jgi:hypothetical protein
MARFQTNRGFMLETVRRRLDGVMFDKAEAAAEYAADEPRFWIEYRASSRDQGRLVGLGGRRTGLSP